MADALRTLMAALAAAPTETYPPAPTLMNALSKMSQVQFGTYAGSTGVAQTITTNGDPRAVLLVDVTQQCAALHLTGMTAAHMFKMDNVAVAHVSANGLTLGTGSFTIGTDANINSTGDSGFWFVIV